MVLLEWGVYSTRALRSLPGGRMRFGAKTVARLEGVMKFSSEKEATRRMNVTRYLVNI